MRAPFLIVALTNVCFKTLRIQVSIHKKGEGTLGGCPPLGDVYVLVA
jgi:hypothetical protein